MAFSTNLHPSLLYHPQYLLSDFLNSLGDTPWITLGFHTPNPAHDIITQLSEVTALQGFCPKIGNHLLGGTPMNIDLLHVDSITHKEVPNVYVPSAFAA